MDNLERMMKGREHAKASRGVENLVSRGGVDHFHFFYGERLTIHSSL